MQAADDAQHLDADEDDVLSERLNLIHRYLILGAIIEGRTQEYARQLNRPADNSIRR